MNKKPPLIIQPTTLWNYPSQHYGKGVQGSPHYAGATPSYIIWNLLQRYTRPTDLVVDPCCGSGTTIDVCNDLGRKVIGFDIAPFRGDIRKADCRRLPLDNASVDFVFVDPPYSDHLEYSGAPECIGRIRAEDPKYFEALEEMIAGIHRILKPRRFMGLTICDSYKKKSGFVPIGFRVFEILCRHFKPADIIAVVRHNKTLKMGNYRKVAVEENYFLRGFNHLFIMKKE